MLWWCYNKQQTLLLIGHATSRFGDQAWNFVVPLVLVVVSKGALWVASFYAICDSHERIQVIRIGALTSVCSVTLLTSLFSLFLKNIGVSACFQGNLMDWLFQQHCSWEAKSLFILLSIVGSGEVIGAFLTRVSVERDWIIEIVDSENLANFNALLRRIDLLSEISAPILVGWFVTTSNISSAIYSILCVGGFNVISFLMEYGMLRWINSLDNWYTSSVTTQEMSVEGVVDNEQQQSDLDDRVASSFSIFIRHPLNLVLLAYGCLWFNATSPHGILLTSYLAEEQVSHYVLGIFRASGAIFGFLGTLVFPWLEKIWGLQMTCLVSILLETITLISSCIFIWSSVVGWSLFVSLALIVLSRVGLYSYELGESLYLQRYTDTTERGRMGAAEGVLTTAAYLGLIAAGLVLNAPQQFLYLWIASATFAALGSLLFIIWCTLFVEDNHYHGDPSAMKHSHTPYQQQQLDEEGHGWHIHLHKR
ncbi:Solute carrier family 40 member 1 [Galdieria sulphuraria]|nr:Solute carrier family 40 member 1 [Galdieria sulphuraria]